MFNKKNKKFLSYFRSTKNVISIHPQIYTYSYSVHIDKINCYLFDKDNICIETTNLRCKNCKLGDLFPMDVQMMFETILSSTYTKPQTIHLIINSIHILFSTRLYRDHKDIACGVVLYEIPFSSVENVEHYLMEMPKTTCSILIDANTNIIGVNDGNLQTMKEGIIKILQQLLPNNKIAFNIPNMFDVKLLNIIPNKMHDTIHKYLKAVLQYEKNISFMHYYNYDGIIILFYCEVSKYKCCHMDEILVTISIRDIFVKEVLEEVMSKSICKTHQKCVVCSRYKCIIDQNLIDDYKPNILSYNKHLLPLYDHTQNIPIFGKRGALGYQNANILENCKDDHFIVWKDLPAKLCNEGVFDVCQICLDELESFGFHLLDV